MNITKILCVAGILLCMIGTILSLWSIISTKIELVGSCEQRDHEPEAFKNEKPRVVVGCLLIIAGSILQIIGTVL